MEIHYTQPPTLSTYQGMNEVFCPRHTTVIFEFIHFFCVGDKEMHLYIMHDVNYSTPTDNCEWILHNPRLYLL
jgi:hypothetical protein